MLEHVDAGLVADRVAQRDAPPRSREVELARVADRRGRRAHALLEPAHGVGVVGVGLVPLDHRELGVVLGRQALVAEVLADLIHALEAAHDAALEIQLGRDPEIHVLVERLEVRHERAGQRAAVERLEHGGLDLDEAAGVEVAADRRDDPRAREEHLARLLVCHQVELAPAQPGLDVGEAVELLRRRPQRLGQHGEVLDAQGQLAALGPERHAVDADDVAEVEAEQQLHALLAELVDARLELDAPGAIDQIEERHLALAAARGEPPGDAVARVGLLAIAELGVRLGHGGGRDDTRIRVRERVDALGAQALELGAPRREQVAWLVQEPRFYRPRSILVILSLRAGPLGTGTDTRSLRLWPISARPTGDSFESLLSAGFASAEPTIVNCWDLPVFWSLTWTIVPTPTTSVVTSLASMTCAERSLSSSWAIRCSSIACSFLASSYSEFSVMSPNSRASLMRSATSRRLSPARKSSSSLSLSSPSWVRITSRGMLERARHGSNAARRAGRALGGCRKGRRGGQQGPGLGGGSGALQGLVEVAVGAEPDHVPGVGLAQPAGGARLAEVLDRPLDQPVELGEHLVAGGFSGPRAENLLEQPRVAERAAGEHDRRGACALERPVHGLGGVQPAGQDHRRGERCGQPGREVVVGRSLVVHLGVAGVEGDRRDTGLVDKPVGQLVAAGVARPQPGPQLDRDRETAAFARRPSHSD